MEVSSHVVAHMQVCSVYLSPKWIGSLCVCVCVCARVRVRVCVRARARHVALIHVPIWGGVC